MRGTAARSTARAARSTSAVTARARAGDDRPPDFRSDAADRGEVAIGGDREPGLDDVDAEPVELPRQPQLFARGHAEAGRLFAVTERGVEDTNSRWISHGHFESALGGLINQIDIVCGHISDTYQGS